MKRDKRLVPLSWGHHELLVYADRVKMALTTDHPAYRHSVKELIEKSKRIWDGVLRLHIEVEKEVLFLSLYQEIQFKSELEILNREFEEITRLYFEISGPHGDFPDADRRQVDKLIRFSELIVHHVRFEERELFPKVQEGLKQEIFNQVGEELSRRLPRHCRMPIK
ncbi:MAG: hypothetical protein HY200_06985 [Nitrospirae bacterium]|nr:hypothetical protein [Nitrospirota bacterium]MBI3594689.1 hypothetical protein [Nitrospirota bacterium]